MDFEGQPFEFFSDPQYLQNGQTDFPQIFSVWGFKGLVYHFDLRLVGHNYILPEQFDSRLERFLHVVHSLVNVSVGQLTKPRNNFRFRIRIVTRINLRKYIDATTSAFYTLAFRAFVVNSLYLWWVHYKTGGITLYAVTSFSYSAVSHRPMTSLRLCDNNAFPWTTAVLVFCCWEVLCIIFCPMYVVGPPCHVTQ